MLCAPKALGTTIGEFSIEQIYVNVPELDVFVQATDAQGQPISPDPVSYTHLDVYKRQVQPFAGKVYLISEQGTLQGTKGAKSIGAEQGTGSGVKGHHPVSYTHLDVYKRQATPCAWKPAAKRAGQTQ